MVADITINGVEYLVDNTQGAGGITIQDMASAVGRATDGEADFVRFEPESNHAISDWSGGAGQARRVSAAMYLCGISETRYEGLAFPARTTAATGQNGGPQLARLGSTLWAYQTGTTIQNANSAGSETKATGTLNHKPTATGGGFHFFTIGNSVYRFSGSAAAVDVTPSGYSIQGVSAQGRHVFGFGTRTMPATPAIVQNFVGTSPNGQVSLSWTTPTLPNSVCVAIVMFGNENEVDGHSVQAAPSYVIPGQAGWVEVGALTTFADAIDESLPRMRGKVFVTETSLTNNLPGSTNVGNRERNLRSGAEFFTVIGIGGDRYECSTIAWMAEFEGVQYGAYGASFSGFNNSTASASTSVSTGTLTNVTNSLKISMLGYADDASTSHALDHAANWTEQAEATVGEIRCAFATSTANVTSDTDASIGATKDAVGGCILQLFPLGTAITQGVIIATDDNGETWLAAPTDFSTNVIGTPKAFCPALDSLFFTTEYGLYRMRYLEREYNDGLRTIHIAIVQLQSFSYYGTAGNWLCHGLMGVYYSLGSTLWRWTEGGGAEQVWPTHGWATTTGTINLGVMAEDALYFSAGGFLWVFDGRNFHPIAALSTTYITGEWFDGDLYVSPSSGAIHKMEFGTSASSRPDIAGIAASGFTTGYVVSSLLDFHKVNVIKFIKSFEGQVRFTAGANSGSVLLEYAIDNGIADPGKFGGNGAGTGVTWTSIGTITTTGPQTFDLTNAFSAKAIWLRATLTPGASGYPALVYQTATGRSKMPIQRRVVAAIKLQVEAPNRAGTKLYPTQSDVATALSALRTLRDSDVSFDIIVDDGGVGETMEVTMTGFGWRRVMERNASGTVIGSYLIAQCTFDELPNG